MSVQAWAAKARSSAEYQSVESQRLIDAYQSLLEGKSTPQDAAQIVSTILEPIIKRSPDDKHTAFVWGFLCDSVRHLGGDKAVSERLVDFLDSIVKLDVKDDLGNIIKHEWGGRFWSNLPTFALMFREYGISIEPYEEMEMEINDWVAQKTPYYNATTFAAVCLTRSSNLSGMAFYIKDCMEEARDESCDEPELRFRAALYMPAASAWISIAGRRIYDMCKDKEWGLSMDDWNSWKMGLGRIGGTAKVDEEARETAIGIKDTMEAIQSEH
ncbi:hypothetical protein M426DRAFT_11879 [Hypoxylon sp. CI-4A]|nr:hypothetical protein M426DRAFT_11879 [Hypoxylon sp. CI-4A]